jgi:FKBP-type peptidyl-prolyl cis-trans isomerase (trigger factor)
MKNIAIKEYITADINEINEKIREMSLRQRQDFESFKKYLEDHDMIDGIEAEIINKKVFEFIVGKANLNLIKYDDSQQGGN